MKPDCWDGIAATQEFRTDHASRFLAAIKVTMTQSEKLTKLLYEIKEGKSFLVTEDDPEGMEHLFDELIDVGLLKKEGSFYRLTREGRFLTNDGKSYDDFECDRHRKQEIPFL